MGVRQNSSSAMDAEGLPHIFDRFYQPDKALSSDTGGYGLGLAIAKTITERSGGKFHAQSCKGVT